MISVVGGGAWGTALAAMAAVNSERVVIYVRDKAVAQEINLYKTNSKYVPGAYLPDNVYATTSIDEVLCGMIFIAVPAQHVRAVCMQLANRVPVSATLVITSKGIENATGDLMSGIVSHIFPHNNICALSGPGLAKEVIAGASTIVTLGGSDTNRVAAAITTSNFFTEQTKDIIGVQICGAMKNVLGIAYGFLLGGGCGENAKSKFFVDAVTEMTTMCEVMGGCKDTASMACGIGDLFLSLSSVSTRNTMLGYNLAKNTSMDIRSMPEGYYTSQILNSISFNYNISLPLCSGIYKILAERCGFLL